MSDTGLPWLMQWYLHQCNGDWEHAYGVQIRNLDNPGWTLKIELSDTALEHRPFTRVEYGEPADDLEEWKRTGSWWVADVKGVCFDGACGPLDLEALINVFRNWAEA